ncbi:MAG: hypothetical protein K2X91_03900, partial [Thermoleophilia bacterium]|nr:hypothetical protein [Thermoleophilia bacterium]
MQIRCAIGLACILAARFASPVGAGEDTSDAHFEARVRPVLVEHCARCHGPEKQRGGLRLDTAEGLQRGGES